MALKGLGAAAVDLPALHALSATSSVWTVDIAHLLRRFQVSEPRRPSATSAPRGAVERSTPCPGPFRSLVGALARAALRPPALAAAPARWSPPFALQLSLRSRIRHFLQSLKSKSRELGGGPLSHGHHRGEPALRDGGFLLCVANPSSVSSPPSAFCFAFYRFADVHPSSSSSN